MNELSERQLQLLKAIIEEYIETAEPVGSETLDKKYNLGVSPATIRNEMVRLTNTGYLKQPHTSAGRTPTPKAMRLYVDKLMKPKELSVADEVSVKQKIWDYRKEMDKLLREATKALAHQTKTMSIAATDEGDIYTSGVGNILDMPEFYDIDVARFILSLFDEFPRLQEIIGKAQGTGPMHILFGEDLGFENLRTTSFVFTRYNANPDKTGIIGVIGPSRMNFPLVLPYVKYVRDLVTQALGGF